MEIPDVLLPEGLARAWSPDVPGPMQQPGPQRAPVSGVVQHPGPVGIPVIAMLQAIWWSGEFHLNPATGLPGKVRQRAVPSAGGCYPVQLRVLCGEGCDVPPGRYVFNSGIGGGAVSSSGGELLRLQDHDAGSHSERGPLVPARGAVVVLTVLPQRTVAKYYHLAGPLLIADTAYAAVALVHHAAALKVPASWDVVVPQLWPGSAPEFALARVTLGLAQGDPARERIAGVTEAQLATRRSADVRGPRASPATTGGNADPVLQGLLDHSLLTFPEPAPPSCRVRVLPEHSLRDPLLAERCAGQHWIGNLHALVVFETSATPTPGGMWWASTLAAHILYTALGTDTALDFRPIGGWTGSHGGWTTLHGLGVVLRKPLDRSHERASHDHQ